MAWQGIFPSIPTAFRLDGDIDLNAQRRIVRFAIEHGAHGMLCFGLAGEVHRLTPLERCRLCEVIVDETNGAIPILVGASAASEHASIGLAREVQRLGASGVVIPVPAGEVLSDAVLLRYFQAVASAVDLPVMIQDAPEYLGRAVRPELVRELIATVPQVSYVKLESGPEGIATWLRVLEGAAAIFGGDGGVYLLDCLRSGARGIAPALDVFDVLAMIYAHESAGQRDEADRLFRRILPMLVFEMQSMAHSNLCAKYVLSKRGVGLNVTLRQPAAELTTVDVTLLDRHLEATLATLSPARDTSVTPHGSSSSTRATPARTVGHTQ